MLKTYGATRRQLIQAFIAEYAVLGIAAAIFGIAVGSIAAWFLAYWILEMPWQFSPATAVADRPAGHGDHHCRRPRRDLAGAHRQARAIAQKRVAFTDWLG